jgi:hypothetical protein
MQNLIPLGTGNSRFMKSNISPSTTLAQLIQMLNNGTFPYDIGTINPEGISQQGTPLNKANLFSDVAALLYPSGTTTPNDAFNSIGKTIPSKKEYVPTATGWFRIAKIQSDANGSYAPSALVSVQNIYASTGHEYVKALVTFSRVSPAITILQDVYNEAAHFFTDMRLMRKTDGSEIYLDVKYGLTAYNRTSVQIINFKNFNYDVQALDIVKVENAPAGEEVLLTQKVSKITSPVRMATYEYIGTGTRGIGNENTFTFKDFSPDLVLIGYERPSSSGPDQSIGLGLGVFMPDKLKSSDYTQYGYLMIPSAIKDEDMLYARYNPNNRKLFWRSNSEGYQLNVENAVYTILAIKGG